MSSAARPAWIFYSIFQVHSSLNPQKLKPLWDRYDSVALNIPFVAGVSSKPQNSLQPPVAEMDLHMGWASCEFVMDTTTSTPQTEIHQLQDRF